jgi:hypothetical protein
LSHVIHPIRGDGPCWLSPHEPDSESLDSHGVRANMGPQEYGK